MPCPYGIAFTITFVQKSPFPLLKKGNRNSPFVEGDLEDSSAQHDFDEPLASNPNG
jgi:hypothetical protein